jgi:hypothetical protein
MERIQGWLGWEVGKTKVEYRIIGLRDADTLKFDMVEGARGSCHYALTRDGLNWVGTYRYTSGWDWGEVSLHWINETSYVGSTTSGNRKEPGYDISLWVY